MSITEQMAAFLNREGAATPKTIADSIPELNQCGGAERALFLLRLNSQFERIDKETYKFTDSGIESGTKEEQSPYPVRFKWTTRGSGKSDEDVIHDTAIQYFKALGKPGAPIANVVMAVTEATGLSMPYVEQALRTQFMTMNTNIFNRLKGQSEQRKGK